MRDAWGWLARGLTALVVINLAACGGGGGDGGAANVTPTVATGVFKDSNVEGLSFNSGAQSGVTGSAGRFTYEVGNTVTFAIGAVTIGAGTGDSTMTPLNLVPGGSTNDTEVQNIARFVQMLDFDGDPDNGIFISPAVQAIAATWPQVDFTTADLASELTTIIADAASVDGTPHDLPTVQAAIDHLFDTFICIHSGAFRGTYSGDDSGPFGVLVNAGTGIVEGVAFSNTDQDFIELTGEAATAVDDQGTFIAGTTSDGATFSGQFTSPDTMQGNWELLATAETGTFSGTRTGGADDAVLRFTGTFTTTVGLPAFGLFAFDVDASDAVTGIALTVAAADGTTDETIGIVGTLTGENLNAQTADGDATIIGTLNRVTGQLFGTWSDSDGNSGTFEGSGCTLNPS
jgi:hypothetical protein